MHHPTSRVRGENLSLVAMHDSIPLHRHVHHQSLPRPPQEERALMKRKGNSITVSSSEPSSSSSHKRQRSSLPEFGASSSLDNPFNVQNRITSNLYSTRIPPTKRVFDKSLVNICVEVFVENVLELWNDEGGRWKDGTERMLKVGIFILVIRGLRGFYGDRFYPML
jgi:hypothetical protein